MHLIKKAVSRAESDARFALRRLSASFRALPTCIIAGAQKAGTSSLYSYLIQHPEVSGAFRKEVHYFDGGLNPWKDNFGYGPFWYRAHFPIKGGPNRHLHFVEASPSYLFVPGVPRRIKELLPNVKVILVLKNPTERAISHYYHEIKAGRETRSIEDALCNPEEVPEKNLEFGSKQFASALRFSYRERGIYVRQVKRYLELFKDEQLHILGSNSLFGNPNSTLKELFKFLNIATDVEIEDTRAKNVNPIKKNVPKKVYEYLDNFYKPYNEELREILSGRVFW